MRPAASNTRGCTRVRVRRLLLRDTAWAKVTALYCSRGPSIVPVCHYRGKYRHYSGHRHYSAYCHYRLFPICAKQIYRYRQLQCIPFLLHHPSTSYAPFCLSFRPYLLSRAPRSARLPFSVAIFCRGWPGRRLDDDAEQNPEVFAQELLTR